MEKNKTVGKKESDLFAVVVDRQGEQRKDQISISNERRQEGRLMIGEMTVLLAQINSLNLME